MSVSIDSGRDGRSALQNWLGALRGVRRERWGDLTGYLFIAPSCLLFFIFGLWPLLRGIYMAFTDYRFLIPDHEPFTGLLNMRELLGDATYWEALVRSLIFTAVYVPINVLVPLALATLIASIRDPRWASVYRIFAYMPVVLPTSVAILLWSELFNSQFGYVNYFLDKILGLGIKPAWFGDPALIVPSMAMASAWKHLGSNTLLFLVGLYNISRELYEAAEIDGAGAWARWWQVTLPMLRPILTLVLVLSTSILSATQEALILFDGAGPQDAAMTVGVYAYMTAFRFGDQRWGYAAAMNLTLGLASMVAAATVFRTMRSERVY
jgi:multiple sugar transport system permease protein